MNRKQNFLRDLFTDPTKNFLGYFAFGIVLITIASDGISNLFWENFGVWLQTKLSLSQIAARSLLVSSIVAIVLTLIYLSPVASWLRDLLFRSVAVSNRTAATPLQAPCKGLIVFMSATDLEMPAEVAIAFHWNDGKAPHLQHCWLICTPTALDRGERAMVSRLADRGILHGIQLYYGDYVLESPDGNGETLSLNVPSDRVNDYRYIKKLVDAIYLDVCKKGLEESEVIADFTGGTKVMTAATILAGSHPNRRLQYIDRQSDTPVLEFQIDYDLKPRDRRYGNASLRTEPTETLRS